MMQIPNLKDISNASRQVATKSAMNPMLWISAIAFPVGMFAAVHTAPPISYAILGVSSLPIIAAVYGFLFFAHTDPDRLQSEQHIENLQVLARMGSSQSGTLLIESASSALNSTGSEAEGGN